MKSWLKRLSRCEVCVSILLLGLVTLLAYAPFIRSLGFYQEDLYDVWSAVTQGPRSLITIYANERPLLGYLFAALFPVLGVSPIAWQVSALVLRLLSVLALFWLLRMVWPQKRLETTAVVLLFAVYPGFLQQPNAHTFHQHLVALLMAIVSIACTIWAIQQKSRLKMVLLHVIAILLMAGYLLLMEFAIGLEVIRLALIWIYYWQVLGISRRQSLVRSLKAWLPYVAAMGVFLIWRLFFFSSARPTTNAGHLLRTYASNLLHMLLSVSIETAKDFFETSVMAWVVPLYDNWYYPAYRQLLVGLLLAFLAGAAVFAYYRFFKDRSSSDEPRIGGYWVWIGIVAVAFAMLPSELSNRNMVFSNRFDRYAIPAMIGVGLLLVGLIFNYMNPKVRPWVISLLVSLAVLTHFNNALIMRDYWNIEKQVWWQLSWRAPGLKDGTLLFVKLPTGFAFQEGYEAWAPANLIYAPTPGSPKIAGEVLNRDTVAEIMRGNDKVSYDWYIPVNLNFETPLVLSLPDSSACLHVIDGRKYEISSIEDPQVQLVAPYSKIDQIRTDVPFTKPPVNIFGDEPAHTWCYYYQKAMYARQIGDWAEIARLGDQVKQKRLGPQVPSEWMPFLEGYASTGRDKEAKNLATIIKTDFGPRNQICQQLATDPAYPPGYAYEQVVDILCR